MNRKGILSRLPKELQEALASKDDEAVDKALSRLSKLELQKAKDVIQQLAAYSVSCPASLSASSATLPDSRDAILEKGASSLPEPPKPAFRVRKDKIAKPPLEWRDDATFRVHTAGADSFGSVLFPVWYATTRKQRPSSDLSASYSGERSDAAAVQLGVAKVFIPAMHKTGSLGSSLLRRLWTWHDDRLVIRTVDKRSESAFWAEMLEELEYLSTPHESFPVMGDDIFLFVHGYNVSFNEAIVSAAQLGFDLAVPGITACFSWPSKGTYLGYPSDEAACEPSVPELVSFIQTLVKAAGTGKLHILAHSMGNRLVLRALEALSWTERTGSSPKKLLGHVLLAAPDVDRDLFRLLAPYCSSLTLKAANLYVSREDFAIYLSRWLHDYDRAGIHPPITLVRGVSTIDVSGADISGHSSFCQSLQVIKDMSKILHHDSLPDDKHRNLMLGPGGGHWQITS